MVNKILAIFCAVMLLFSVPLFSYGTQYYTDGESSDDYEYVDENGNIIEDNGMPNETVDTSWFDSTKPAREYHIRNKAELLGLASLVNEIQPEWKENAHETFEGVTFYLDRDIELKSEWKPIGDDKNVYFAGTFDGRGHTISGINIESNNNNVGFFGYLAGTAKNLKLEGSVTSGKGPCGAFAGHLTKKGKISNCEARVKVRGRAYTGGIVGLNYGGSLANCVNRLSVSGTRNVGGIAGENRGEMTECTNYGNIKSTRRGTGTFGTGGVAGRTVSSSTISNCSNAGKITSVNEATGGVVGFATKPGTTVAESVNSGRIKIKNPAAGKNAFYFDSHAGGVAGILGSSGVEIRHSYSSGVISGADVTGGITGGYLNEEDKDHIAAGVQLLRWQHNMEENQKTTSLSQAKATMPKYKNLYRYEKSNPAEKRKGFAVLKYFSPVGLDENLEIGKDGPVVGSSEVREYLESLTRSNAEIAEAIKAEKRRSQSADKHGKKSAAKSKPESAISQYRYLEEYEKNNPIESRKGFAILKYFRPLLLQPESEDYDLDNIVKK